MEVEIHNFTKFVTKAVLTEILPKRITVRIALKIVGRQVFVH